jgi:methyl-accepting chemotaxis protein
MSGDTDTTDEVKRQKKQAQTDEAYERAVREIDWIIVAITSGDLTQKIMIQPEELGSDIAILKRSINVLVDQLQAICSRVSSVARQVGKEGILGGQAHAPNASGIWEEMVNNGASILISPSQPIKITLQSRD